MRLRAVPRIDNEDSRAEWKLTWLTMKWFTLKSSLNCCMGKSFSMLPSEYAYAALLGAAAFASSKWPGNRGYSHRSYSRSHPIDPQNLKSLTHTCTHAQARTLPHPLMLRPEIAVGFLDNQAGRIEHTCARIKNKMHIDSNAQSINQNKHRWLVVRLAPGIAQEAAAALQTQT